MCFGGSAPAAPPPTPPPAQLAQTPTSAAVRQNTAANVQQAGTTLLTGGMGDAASLANNLGKKTLLGQ